jgi:nuclear transport factor 2 (NTF2) superfamily protein
MWAFTRNRIAVRFAYESHDSSGQWWRSHGNENWEFDDRGLMRIRLASISDQRITEADRMFFWDRTGPRPISSGLKRARPVVHMGRACRSR